ncbi:hypothetical protein [Dyella caseinilytica]|uniref:Uncharacterized protein n=1 Tax=Dyella caseinilytica TaxID=1849581 RepID=A0ABX7GQ75_9GAMM|nr:hypothetical protein [Dyella caseinilytica]QRN52410.1 hypothetical protein ISN74_13080 [Dyella caseinilytica]GGA05742.1 hypothetical protein GCM10011408_28350 [Dyella caseinilytica]
MKANEITQPGYYWLRDGGESEVVSVTDPGSGRLRIYFHGLDQSAALDGMPGEFTGPIAEPTT